MSSRLPRLYVLHGEDEFASAEFLTALKEKLGDPTTAALNTTEFDGRSLTLADLQAACGAMPFLARRRLVIVRGLIARLTSRGQPKEDEEDGAAPPARQFLADFLQFVPSVPETTALVLVEQRALTERNAVLKFAAQHAGIAFVKRFDLPKGEGLARWIAVRAKAQGGAFTPAATAALAAAVGDDPRAADGEIAKLLAYVNYSRPVEAGDVELLTPYSRAANVFEMVDAIGMGDARKAMALLQRLLADEDPLYAFAMIVRQFRLLLQTREILETRGSETAALEALHVQPFVARKLVEQARGFALTDLEDIYRRLFETDVQVKTGQVDSRAALDLLVAAVTGQKTVPAVSGMAGTG